MHKSLERFLSLLFLKQPTRTQRFLYKIALNLALVLGYNGNCPIAISNEQARDLSNSSLERPCFFNKMLHTSICMFVLKVRMRAF